MKQLTKILRNILPHLCIMICGMFIVFYLIDNVNPIMNFIYHDMTEGLLLAAAIMGIINSLILISDAKKSMRKKKRRHSN